MIYMPVIMSVLGLAYVFIRRSWVMKQDPGDGKMKEISDHIYEGALAFLNAEYRLLTIFVLIVSIILAGISFIVPTTHILIVVSFIFGAFFSAFAGNIGMKIATKTNVRTTQAAKTSLPKASLTDPDAPAVIVNLLLSTAVLSSATAAVDATPSIVTPLVTPVRELVAVSMPV